MPSYSAGRLIRVARAIFRASGAPEDAAARVAEALVDANLAGHDSHGVIRIPEYVKAIEAGELVPDARPEVVQETPTSALVDGHWTFGQVVAQFAVGLAVAKARESGVAAVGIVRTYHMGRMGEYPTMASAEGVISLLFAGGFGGLSRVAPYGGAGMAYGTNPIAIGLPAGAHSPVMADFATSSVAAGKVALAYAKGEQLPAGCIISQDGQPTTDPADYLAGGYLLPFGGHKGYALAVVAELLGQAVTGADAMVEGGRGGDTYGAGGALIIALNAGLFRAQDGYVRAVDSTLDRIKAVPAAPGFKEVLLPGEPEVRARQRRLTEGIPVAETTWEEIRTCGAHLGVDAEAL